MRIRNRVLALTSLAGALAIVGTVVITLGAGARVHAQTATPTPATNVGGPSQVPSARFFGTVSVNGSAPTAGASISATIGTVVCGTAVPTGTNYSLDIQALSGCTTPGASVTFTLNGVPAGQTGTLPPIQGSAVQLNLTFAAATPSPTPAATTAPPPPPPPPPTATPARTPTPAPTAAPPTRTAVVPTAPPNTGLGGGSQQKPSGPAVAQKPAAPVAQRPAAPVAQAPQPAVAPALPNTGTGGLIGTGDQTVLFGLLALAAAAVLGAAGAILAIKRA